MGVTTRRVESGLVATGMGSCKLPPDWTLRKLCDLSCKLITYGIVQPGPDIPTGVPFIQTKDLTSGVLDQRKMDRTSHEIHAAYSRSAVSSGDIVIGIRASVGMVAYVPPELHEANISRGVARISPTADIDGGFLYWALQSESVASNIHKEVKGSTYAEITLPALRGIEVSLPPYAEQRAMAAALTDVDGLVAALDKLIAKKRAIRLAAMQQLLTGKTRLPGFKGKWQKKRLGDVVEIQKGQLITEQDAIPGPIPVIAGGKTPSYYHNEPNRTGRTIAVSGSGAYAGYVAFFNTPIFASDCSTISESPDYDIKFIYYFLILRQTEIYNAQTGGAQPHIHPSDLMPLGIEVPEATEQNAIATVLSDMDVEIAALERRRDKTKAIRQGMMQELLAGRTRLIDKEGKT